MKHARTLLAVWAGKIAIAAARALGRGGSSFPGTLARAIDPDVLAWLAAQPPLGNVAVTGTNGKTTTAKMLSTILAQAGHRVTHNRAGANLLGGLTTAYLAGANWLGRVRGDLGLMEVDEATMPRAAAALRPRVAVVTNFFRDQLDRYGELMTTVRFVQGGLAHLAPGGRVCLNADDPLCAALGAGAAPEVAAAREVDAAPVALAGAAGAPGAGGPGGATPLYYGIEDGAVAAAHSAHAADVRHCVRCGRPYQYELYVYAHLGRYRCPHCGLSRPRPQVYAQRVWDMDARSSTIDLVTPVGAGTVRLQVPGLYNIYNALAAAAGACALGLGWEAIKAGLEATQAGFGRMERLTLEGREVFVALVKNPVGYNEVLRTVLASGQPCHLVLALNDLYADGTDVSWIWDVDFEMLAAHPQGPCHVVCTGLRAEDLAVRLKYAGVDPARLHVERDMGRALDYALRFVRPGETLYVLPTYTAMLQVRRLLQRRGRLSPFWEV